MPSFTLQLTFYIIVIFASKFSETARILGLFPYPLKSHFIIFDSLLTELADRGHDVTVVTSFPKCPHLTNYSQIDVSRCVQIPKSRFSLEFSLENYGSPFRLFNSMEYCINLFDDILECQAMEELKTARDRYDLVITELFCTDILLAYPYIYKTPFILFSSLPLLTWHSVHVANIENPSIIPLTFNDYSFDTKHPRFTERLYNTFIYIVSKAYNNFKWITQGDHIIRKHFGNSIPSAAEIAKNASLIFTYSHFSMHRPRPHVPAVIEVGGLNVRPPRPLPEDIKKFMDEAKHGVVYFCLGSLMQAQSMPETIRHAFIRSFVKFPQRVLWKWENETIPEKSDKIMIKDWMPQRDILAHPNVKLFITHGGSLGINEAVYEGVPILAIPFYGDQQMNSQTIQSAGAGEVLQYHEITEKTVTGKIKKILYDKTYAENMKKLSNIYKDRPATPMETAVYWTEYVLRHKHAPHLKSAAIHLPWYQYLLLDVITLSLIITITILYLTRKILSLLIGIIKKFLTTKLKYKRH